VSSNIPNREAKLLASLVDRIEVFFFRFCEDYCNSATERGAPPACNRPKERNFLRGLFEKRFRAGVGLETNFAWNVKEPSASFVLEGHESLQGHRGKGSLRRGSGCKTVVPPS
jgi:hypothetical protein